MEKTKYKYVQVIDRYFSGECEDFSEIYLLGSKKVIVDCFKKYALVRVEKADEVYRIIDNIEDYLKQEFNSENFKELLIELSEQLVTRNYILLATSLLVAEKDEAIEIFHKKCLTQKEFDRFIKQFTNKFPNQKNEIEYFEKTYKEYKEYYKINEEKKNQTYINVKFSRTEQKYQNLRELFDSDLSVEEYCAITGKKMSMVQKSLEVENKKLQPFIEIIKERSNEEFFKQLKIIVFELSEIKDFDMIDYYERTNLTVSDFIQSIYKLDINPFSEIVYDEVITRLKKIRNLPKINKAYQLGCETIISGRKLEKEEKEKIFNYLEENDLDVNLYRTALDRYLNGALQLRKSYTLKK